MLHAAPLLLPLASFILIFACLLAANAGRCACPQRTAFLQATLVLGAIIIASTEILSVWSLVTRHAVVFVWSATFGALALIAAIAVRRIRGIPQLSLPRLSMHDTIMISTCLLFFTIEAVIALAAPPSTWDSMTYHMSRVMHWIQNQSLGFYETNILRQLYSPPGAEMAVLHTMLLAQSDRFVNMVQLFSMIGTAVCASCIARELGGARRVQIFAAVFTATIPMAILQSTSTQNDLVISLWVSCFTLFMLRLRTDRSLCNTVAVGVSLGLCLVTKGTALVFLPPLVAAGCFMVMFSRPEPLELRLMTVALIVAAIGLAMPLPHLARTNALFGTAINPNQLEEPGLRVKNERINMPIFAANIVRNLGMHVATPSHTINLTLEQGIRKLLGSEINNPASTWPFSQFRIRLSCDESGAPAPLHVALIVFAGVLLFSHSQSRRRSRVLYLLGALMVSFLLFCLLLKWQPFHGRLHLPLLVSGAPLAAVIITGRLSRRMQTGILVILLVGALPFLLGNATRPLAGDRSVFASARHDGYFSGREDIRDDWRTAVQAMRELRPKTIGLACGNDSWEYPLWVLMEVLKNRGPAIEHCLVNNISSQAERKGGTPDLIVSLENSGSPPLSMARIGSIDYAPCYRTGALSVLTPRSYALRP